MRTSDSPKSGLAIEGRPRAPSYSVEPNRETAEGAMGLEETSVSEKGASFDRA